MFNNQKIVLCDVDDVLATNFCKFLEDYPISNLLANFDHITGKAIKKEIYETLAYRQCQENDCWELIFKLICQKGGEVPEYINTKLLTDTFTKYNHSILRTKRMKSVMGNYKHMGVKPIIFSDNVEFWFTRQFNELQLGQIFNPGEAILSYKIAMPKIKIFEQKNLLEEHLLKPYDCEPKDITYYDDDEENINAALTVGIDAIKVS